MSATVKMKRSAVALSAPTLGQLALGELAINTTDGKLFLKKSVNGVESIVDVTKSPDAPYTLNPVSVTAARPPFATSNIFSILDVLDGTDGLTGSQGNHKVIEVGASGMYHQIAFTDDRILRYRTSVGVSNWSSWKQIWDSVNLTNLNQLTNGPGYTANLGTVTGVTGSGAISVTAGDAPTVSVAAASTTAPGTMSAADKVKLNAITGTNTGDQINITGNAGTATKLAAARTINGVAFDGSASITINAVDATARQAASEQDAANGYVGLTLLKINFKNALNTFTSFFTNANTAARIYTFPDKSGTMATTSGDSISVVDHAVTGMLLVSTTVTAQNATVTLPVTSISGGIITTAPAAAITLTMPTGTAMCAEMGALSIVGQGISWSIINTSASFAATLAVGTSHTLVGDKVIAPGVSARFTTVESGVNTCVTYRIA